MRDALTAALAKRGVRIVLNDVFTRIEKMEGGLTATSKCGEILRADQIMFAIGRSPNTLDLGLAEAGVETGMFGEVLVEGSGRTNVESVFAVGDVTNRLALTPVAIRQGQAFADSAFGPNPWTVDYEAVPTAVFSTPEIGTVGLAEHIAASRYGALDVYKASFRPMKAILAGRDERTMMKLVVDRASQRVLGVHILGPDAAEIVQVACDCAATEGHQSRFRRDNGPSSERRGGIGHSAREMACAGRGGGLIRAALATKHPASAIY